MSPEELDRQLRTVIARLELVSSAATCNYNPDGAGNDSSGLPVGDRNPPHERYRRRLAGVDRGLQRRLDAAEAEGDHDQRATLERKAHAWRHETRTGILKAAEAELQAMTGRDGKAPNARKAMMDTDAGVTRTIADEAPGVPARVVAERLGLTVFSVRRRYVELGLDPDDGEPLTAHGEDWRRQARALQDRGLSERQIVMVMRSRGVIVSQPTMHRALTRAA